MAGRAYIGTGGWNYAWWHDEFYRGVPRKNWLGFCAHRFNSVEVNAGFYRLQNKETFRRWRDAGRFPLRHQGQVFPDTQQETRRPVASDSRSRGQLGRGVTW